MVPHFDAKENFVFFHKVTSLRRIRLQKDYFILLISQCVESSSIDSTRGGNFDNREMDKCD